MGNQTRVNRDWLKPLSLGLGSLCAAALLTLARTGPDFDHYLDWSEAFTRGNIFEIRGWILSPNRVPLTVWSHGTGLILAVPRLLLGERLSPALGGLLVGWLAGLAFWAAMFRLLSRAAGGDGRLTLFGIGVAFLGTHAGFYSHTHASESIGYALAGILGVALLPLGRWRIEDALVGGAAGALLIGLRPNLALLALPAAALLAARALGARRSASPAKVAIALAWIGLTTVVSLLQVGLVNRWMTGSWVHSPYSFGGDGFQSIDFGNLQLGSVLFHPWHGLLIYHPLYAVAMVALVCLIWRAGSRREGLTWLGLGTLVLVQLMIQAGWFFWWLGTATFGQRGMSIAAVVLAPALVAGIGGDQSDRGVVRRTLILLSLACCLWSSLLLLQGETSFYTYAQLLESQAAILGAVVRSDALLPLLAALVLPMALVVWILRRIRGPASEPLIVWATGLILFMGLGYLGMKMMTGGPEGLMLFGWVALVTMTGGLLASALGRGIARRAAESGRSGRASGGLALVMVAGFASAAVLFGRLAIRTERRIASEEPPPRLMLCTSTVVWDEIRESFAEYQQVPGFTSEKAALEKFLIRRGGEECPRLALP